MTKIKMELLNILDQLKEDKFKKFKWYLEQKDILEGFTGIPGAELEKAEKQHTVDLMVQKYREPGALQLTMKVLEKIDRNDLVQHLEKSCSGPKDSRSKPPTVFSNNEVIRIVLVGKTGVGKSATGNTILGNQYFKSEFSPKSVTEHCGKGFAEVDGQKVAVIDTPGLFDTRNTEEETVKDIAQSIACASPGPHIFLVVIKLGVYTKEGKQTVQKIQKTFGEEADKYCMVLFTHGDLLKGKPIEFFLNCSEDLQELVAKYNNQYHVFNNKVKDLSQVSELLDKIRNINVKNGGSYYTTDMFQKAKRAIEEEKQRILKERKEEICKKQGKLRKKIEKQYQQQQREVEAERETQLRAAQAEREEKQRILKEKEEQNRKEQDELRKEIEEKYQKPLKEVCANTSPKVINNEIRIVLVGKTGVGKSATGNTILGEKRFKSEFTFTSLTEHCDKAYGEVDGQKVAVIDTPGLFHTRNSEEKTFKDISQCISYASPGPHIFLVVIRVGRFAEEEKQTVQKIQKIFGEELNKYCMVLFTGGDMLEDTTIEEFMKDSEDLQELVAKCNNHYHVFNNKVKDRSQVSELLDKIRNINVKNGGSYYTTEMFQKAKREEEKQQILKEKEEQNRKEQEKLMKELEEKYQQQLREIQAEREKQLRAAQAEREKEKQSVKT